MNNSNNQQAMIPEFNLAKYICFLCSKYHIGINLHDIAGVSQIDKMMTQTFSPYLCHNNLFCNYVKQFKITHRTCSRSKDVLSWMCSRKKTPFYGRCYMGVEELRFPIRWNGRLIAFICVGQFHTDLAMSLNIVLEKASLYGLNTDEAKKQFLAVSKPIDFDIAEFSQQMGLLVEYLALRYGKFLMSASEGNNIEKAAESHKQNYIINRTLSYIHENYMNSLSLKVLIGNCYCSEPYLCSLFKEKVGSTITSYINKFRISKAKELLEVTVLPITEIAYQCGFNDSNYFSRVFRKHTGLCPKKYRLEKIKT